MRRNWPFLAIGLAFTSSSLAGGLPKHVGQCRWTRVTKIEPRLVDGETHQPILGAGSRIEFRNGVYQVSYDEVEAVAGDPVRMCLVSIPKGCPPGDYRGGVYRTTNFRTRASWTLPNAEHMCGGA